MIKTVAGARKIVIWYYGLSTVCFRELIPLANSAIIEVIRALQKSGLASQEFTATMKNSELQAPHARMSIVRLYARL